MTMRDLIQSMGGVASVAARMRVTNQAVYVWINNGKMPEGTAYKFAHVYGLDPTVVVGLGRDAA